MSRRWALRHTRGREGTKKISFIGPELWLTWLLSGQAGSRSEAKGASGNERLQEQGTAIT